MLTLVLVTQVEIVIEHDDGEKSDADEEDVRTHTLASLLLRLLLTLPVAQDDLIFSLDADDHKGGKGAGARKVDPNVDKLDELMGLMFEYLALIRKGKASMCDEVRARCRSHRGLPCPLC